MFQATVSNIHRLWNFTMPSCFCERNNPGRTWAVQHNMVLELEGLYVSENLWCALPIYPSVILWIMLNWQTIRTKVGPLQIINHTVIVTAWAVWSSELPQPSWIQSSSEVAVIDICHLHLLKLYFCKSASGWNTF